MAVEGLTKRPAACSAARSVSSHSAQINPLSCAGCFVQPLHLSVLSGL